MVTSTSSPGSIPNPRGMVMTEEDGPTLNDLFLNVQLSPINIVIPYIHIFIFINIYIVVCIYSVMMFQS